MLKYLNQKKYALIALHKNKFLFMLININKKIKLLYEQTKSRLINRM